MLSDSDKRERYDRFGKAAVSSSGPNGGGGSEGMFGGDARDFFRGFGGRGMGGGFGGGAHNPFAQAFNVPVVLQVDLTLEDMFLGKDMNIELDMGDRCVVPMAILYSRRCL